MPVADPVPAYDTIQAFKDAGIAVTSITKVYIRGYKAESKGRGGGFLNLIGTTGSADDVLVFAHGVGSDKTYWERDLAGGTLDAYMAGAVGGAALNEDGTIANGWTDDFIPIQALLDAVTSTAGGRTNTIKLRFGLGSGSFYVKDTLNLKTLPGGVRGWEFDGTGTVLLGACPGKPILDLTDRRFGTVPNLQAIGVAELVGGKSQPICSCGIRIGRIADNAAANQMTMDHVGLRGYYHVAALLNVASEQHTSIACEYYNEAEGARYGYAADAYNSLQWERPYVIQSVTGLGGGNFSVTANGNTLQENDVFLVRGDYDNGDIMNNILFTKTGVGTTNTFTATASFSTSDTFTGGFLYKRLYGGAVDTPGLAPWTQASMKQQLHLNCRYGAPKGIAAVFEGTDSMHVFQACHPTCGYYASGADVAIQTIMTNNPAGATKVKTQAPHALETGHLVSLTGFGKTTAGLPPVPTPFANFAGDRLFIAVKIDDVQFELRDLKNLPVDSTGWGALPEDRGVATRQQVAEGDDPYAGGFGMRLVVGQATGCDVSDYLLHHEGGTADGTTWWGSIESMEGLRDGVAGPVTLTDVTFREPAASGRGGFLLAQRGTVSAVTMVGGKVAVAHPHREFGNLSQADRVLTATGTGDSPWTLTGTELVLEDAALVNAVGLAGFTGRVSAGDLSYTAGLAIGYPGTLAAVGALRPDSRNFTTFVRRYDALLRTLDDAGVLAKLDALHVFATENQATARINLADPAGGPLVLAGSGGPPGFVARQGYTGAAGQYFLSPLGPTPNAHYGLNAAAMGVVSRSTGGTAVSRDVSLDGTFAYVDPWSGGTPQFHTRANDAVDTPTTLPGASSLPAGFFAWSRTSPTSYVKYYGSAGLDQPTAVPVSTSVSGSLPATGFEVLRGGSHQISAAFFGGGLSGFEMTALYDALRTYLTAVGAWL